MKKLITIIAILFTCLSFAQGTTLYENTRYNKVEGGTYKNEISIRQNTKTGELHVNTDKKYIPKVESYSYNKKTKTETYTYMAPNGVMVTIKQNDKPEISKSTVGLKSGGFGSSSRSSNVKKDTITIKDNVKVIHL